MNASVRRLLESKLTQLVRFREELESVTALAYDPNDFKGMRTAERDIELLIEFSADTVNHLLLDRGLPPSESYRDAFVKAMKAGIISPELAGRLIPLASLRNRLVHEYDEEFDPHKAYEAFRAAPEVFREFTEKIFALL